MLMMEVSRSHEQGARFTRSHPISRSLSFCHPSSDSSAEMRMKSAGLRIHTLVGVAAALLMRSQITVSAMSSCKIRWCSTPRVSRLKSCRRRPDLRSARCAARSLTTAAAAAGITVRQPGPGLGATKLPPHGILIRHPARSGPSGIGGRPALAILAVCFFAQFCDAPITRKMIK